MNSVIISKAGGPEVLEYKDLKLEEPKADEVTIKNHAIGLNYIDTYHRSGLYPLTLPSPIGLEGAGEITKVGSDVKDFKVGRPTLDRTTHPAPVRAAHRSGAGPAPRHLR